MTSCEMENQQTQRMEKVLQKIKQNGCSFGGRIPVSHMNADGTYALNNGGSWTDGFYIGVFHLAYLLSGDEEFREIADSYREFISLRVQNTDEVSGKYHFPKLDHDVGMIFLPSAGFGYHRFGSPEDRDILIRAADTLKERFNEKGNFIRAWNTWGDDTPEFAAEKKGKIIIDSMMNIPLLYQVSEITGDPSYYEVAYKHAQTVAKYIVRQDYSTYHTYNFDPQTGRPIGGKTHQGYADESCWSRGQSWAVYGFALSYKYTKDPRFLDLAEKTARYFMEHLSAVDLPAWDFSTTDFEFVPWDASASVICASGLLELAELTGQNAFREDAIRLLNALERYCLTDGYEGCQPLILHNTAGPVYQENNLNELKVRAIDQASVYADYFYLECKLKMSSEKLRIF